MNDDTVVGTLWADDPYRHTETVYLSNLDDTHRTAILAWRCVPSKMRDAAIRIADLEAQLAKTEAALRDAESFLDEVNGLESGEDSRPLRDRIEAEINAHGAAWGLERERLARAEAALEVAEDAIEKGITDPDLYDAWLHAREEARGAMK